MYSRSYIFEQQFDKRHLPHTDVIGIKVTSAPFMVLSMVILRWAKKHESRYICVANTHMLIEAHRNDDFRKVLKNADMITPDGMPLVWMLKVFRKGKQDRVAGLDLLQYLCQQASEHNVSIFFLGSISCILQKMRNRLKKEFPHLSIAGMEPLPFRPLTTEENQALIKRVNESGAGIVMVALGCPKQEYWMASHKNQIRAAMIGLGGAFPVYAGLRCRAPFFIRKMGLEWFFRLIQEPRRLWKRYVTTIPTFIYLSMKQILHWYFKCNK